MDEQFKRLVTVFGVPSRPNPEAFIREFCAAVGTTWPAGVLQRAVDRLIAEHNEPGWPRPAALKELCRAECPRHETVGGLHDDRPPLTQEQIDAQAETVRKFRQRMAAMKLDDDEPTAKLPDVGRSSMETMMANSPNQHLYRRRT